MGGGSDELLRDILTTVKTIAEEQVAMRKDIVVLQKGQDSLQKGQESLQKGQDSLQKGLDELRRVTSVNHYKTIGRIEGLESMLAVHMTDHGHCQEPVELFPPVKAGG